MPLSLRTEVCDLLGCEYPVVLAGMGGVARSQLVAAVTEAGGFGFLGMVREPASLIREEIGRVRGLTNRPFGINLIPAATQPDLLESELAACITAKVHAVTLFWDIYPPIIARLHEAGILVCCQIGSEAEARQAHEAGADIIIAQGCEAGGHVRGATRLHALLPGVLASTDRPVLAAGGIVDGHDLAAVLRLGAQGAMIGTAFLATEESFAHDFHKQAIIDANSDTTVLTEAFHINWPPGAAVRVLAGPVTDGMHGDPQRVAEKVVIGDEAGRPIYLFSTDSPLRITTGNLASMALYAGQSAHRIKAIVPAGERLRSIVSEAATILAGHPDSKSENRINEPSSPVCYAKDDSSGVIASAPAQGDWEQIKIWRRGQREHLIRARIQAGGKQRRLWEHAITPRLEEILAAMEPGIIGLYWPFKGEFDARDLVVQLLMKRWSAALPVVVQPRSPLEFRAWTPQSKMVPGIWNIPVPEDRRIVTPTVLLVPLVGFDGANYRLGYGGGYYDRTIASLTPRPRAIGVGYVAARMETIYPQAHDIPMDIIITESDVVHRANV